CASLFFFQAEDGIRDRNVTGVRRVLFRSGSYPGGRLYSLDPETREFTDHGQALSSEQYVRSIAPAGNTLYIGTQQAGHLLTFDRSTGEFIEIPMPSEHGVTGIEAIALRGDLLFVGTDGIFIRDLTRDKW